MKVMFIGAHPDDETISCGGTIARFLEEGYQVYWLLAGSASEGYFSKQEIKEENQEIENLLKVFKGLNLRRLHIPSSAFSSYQESKAISSIRDIIEADQIEQVFSVASIDIHSDHRFLNSWVSAAIKPFRRAKVKLFADYETLSSTDQNLNEVFKPNLFLDISQHIDSKIKALKAYPGQIPEKSSPRSIENILALAKLRGSQIGTEYAEAFKINYSLI